MAKKKKKTEFYDTYHGYKWTAEGALSEEEMLAHIKNNWLEPHDKVLADFNKAGHLKELARRYAHGDTYLASRTQKARDEYIALFNHELLPKEQRRRVIDVIAQRIKDVLPNLATRVAVEEVIQCHPDFDDREIAKLLYHLIVEEKKYSCDVPNTHFVKNIRAQMNKNGGVLPEFCLDTTTKFMLSVTDQLSKVERVGENRNYLALTIKAHRKTGRLIFKLPDKKRYLSGKPTLPYIMRTANNEQKIMFDFSIKHNAPTPYEPVCSLGADVGVVYPVTSALVGQDWYSQAFYPPGWVLDLVDKLNDLAFQKSVLELKIEQNSMPNRLPHENQKFSYEELVERDSQEAERLAGKMTDIKREIARWAAHSLCETAMSHHAQIVFEQLNWSEPSHAFFYNMMHEATRNLALTSGIPVVTVSAKDTSAKCHHDGRRLVQQKKEKPPVVKSGSKKRSGWRAVDRKSGQRDFAVRKRLVKDIRENDPESAVNEFSLPFDAVLADHTKNSDVVYRGALCPVEGIVRDHDCVGARNLGASGEVERGSISSCHCLSGFEFRRVRRRDSNLHFGWAVSLSATAAVSASAPVTGLASVSNDAVGPESGGSPPV